MNTLTTDEHTETYHQLIRQQKTLILSTVDKHGEPESSYAPYVRDQAGVFYIYVSELASHTQNMLQKPRASLLFIRPEAESKNLFARERVVFHCNVIEIQPNDQAYEQQLLEMKRQLGETIELLRSLPDFHLLVLTPVKGKYIAGFGQAFQIDLKTDRVVEHD